MKINMQISLSLKMRIKPSSKQAKQLSLLMQRYAKACTWCSKYYFEHNMTLGKVKLHNACYYDIRSKFGLKSQLAASVPRTVIARYQAVSTQMQRTYYHFQDKSTKRWYRVQRNKYWLQNSIQFHTPQADLVRNRDWSFTNGKISLNTLHKREQMPYVIPDHFKKYLNGNWKLGTGKLVHKCGKWFFHIGMTGKVPKLDLKKSKHIVGIDRGLRFIANTFDDKKQDLFFNGKPIIKKRKHFLNQRRKLQSKQTRTSKRKLRKLSGRENRWMTDVNHRISKALVDYYGPRTTFVLEDLKDIRWTLQNVSRQNRYTQVSWAFYQLGNMLTYKAKLNHDRVIHINPHYTSQRCPNCGRILKENRNHIRHYYRCQYCGYQINDDLVGAMNIQYLGKQICAGKKHVKIRPMKTIHPIQLKLKL